MVLPHESLQVLTPLMLHSHTALREAGDALPLGPYFPRPGQPAPPAAAVSGALRPPRPMLQMTVPRLQISPNKVTAALPTRERGVATKLSGGVPARFESAVIPKQLSAKCQNSEWIQAID